MCYLGYANKLKGFEFLLIALEQSSPALLSNLYLTIAVREIDGPIESRLHVLKLAGLSIYHGYSHDQLNGLLRQVDLGIIPVVWEDCLPQVAIEFVAHGVPIITSKLGGAREIGANPDFEFDVDNPKGLMDLLTRFANDKRKLAEFWKNKPLLRSMEAHTAELLQYYNAARRSSIFDF